MLYSMPASAATRNHKQKQSQSVSHRFAGSFYGFLVHLKK